MNRGYSDEPEHRPVRPALGKARPLSRLQSSAPLKEPGMNPHVWHGAQPKPPESCSSPEPQPDCGNLKVPPTLSTTVTRYTISTLTNPVVSQYISKCSEAEMEATAPETIQCEQESKPLSGQTQDPEGGDLAGK